MKYKLMLLMAGIAVMMGAGIVAAQAESKNVSATIYVQEQSNWCWAATSRTVIAHITGRAASQCQLVKWGKDKSSCANVTASFGRDVARVLFKGGVNDLGTYDTTTISYGEVKGQVRADHLTMIRWGWTSGGGHMLVLRGYNTSGSQISYINPLNSSFQSGSYTYLVGGSSYDHRWTDTRYNIL